MNRALTLKWFAVLGLASLFYLLAPRDVSPQIPLYLGMTSAAVIIWTFDLLPAVAVAAALTFLYLLTNMAPPEVVLGPWTTVLIWTTFGAAIFGEAMEKTGLAKRVALRCMLLTGGTFTGMLIGFAIGGIILGLLLASGLARTVIFCAIAVGIIRALDIDPKSRLSSIIVIACFFAAAAPTMQFLHTSESFIWSFQVLMKAIGGNVDWWEYLNHACFINTIYVALSFLTIYFMRGKVRLPEGGKLKLILEERLAEMGPMTVSEKRLLVLAILGILVQRAMMKRADAKKAAKAERKAADGKESKEHAAAPAPEPASPAPSADGTPLQADPESAHRASEDLDSAMESLETSGKEH